MLDSGKRHQSTTRAHSNLEWHIDCSSTNTHMEVGEGTKMGHPLERLRAQLDRKDRGNSQGQQINWGKETR